MFVFVRVPSRSVHPYANPEVLSFAVEDGSLAYMKWMDEAIPDNWYIIKIRANLCMDCSRTRKMSHAYRLFFEGFGSKGSESTLLNKSSIRDIYTFLLLWPSYCKFHCVLWGFDFNPLKRLCTTVIENTCFWSTGRYGLPYHDRTCQTNEVPVNQWLLSKYA